MSPSFGSGLAFLAGLGLAFLGHLTLAASPEAPATVTAQKQTRSVPKWVRADCPDEVDDGTRITELTSELAEKQLQLKAAWAREAVYSGAPVDWPSDVDTRFTEDTVVGFLEASLAESGGTLLGYDCSEYPCVATLGWQMYGDAHPGMDLISKGYEGGYGSTVMIPHSEDDGISYVLSMAFRPDEDLDDNAKKRMMFRIKESMTISRVPKAW